MYKTYDYPEEVSTIKSGGSTVKVNPPENFSISYLTSRRGAAR